MQTKLIATTEPHVQTTGEGTHKLTPEEFIVYIARVSNPSNQLNVDTSNKLLRYLITHKHYSPFEHVSCTFEIKTSRAIAAQILRHRSFTFQEFSQRYAQATELEVIEWRKQGKTNRQVGDAAVDISNDLATKIAKHQEAGMELYKEITGEGIAKECARMILPLNTQTVIYMTGSVRSWLSYLNIRLETHTQKEHRDIAVSIAKDISNIFPATSEALNTFNNYGGGFM